MINLRLMAAVLVVASCVGQPQQLAREQQDHDAECRRFRAAVDSPTYIDCRVALRALEQLERGAPSLLNVSIRHGAGGLDFDRDSRKQNQGKAAHTKGGSEESGCARMRAGQLIIFECGLGIPLTDLLAGLDQ